MEAEEITAGLDEKARAFHKFLVTNTPETLREMLEKLPVVDAGSALFSSPSDPNSTPTQVVSVVIPEGFPDVSEGVGAMAKWALQNLRGSYPTPALGADVVVTRYGITHTAQQTRRNPERMRVIAALPEILLQARQIRATDGDIIQLHALAMIDEQPTIARITIESRSDSTQGKWNRFYDIKGIETESASDAFSAFPPQGDGSILANPRREVTLDQLAAIVNKAEGGAQLFSSPGEFSFNQTTDNGDANQKGFNFDTLPAGPLAKFVENTQKWPRWISTRRSSGTSRLPH